MAIKNLQKVLGLISGLFVSWSTFTKMPKVVVCYWVSLIHHTACMYRFWRVHSGLSTHCSARRPRRAPSCPWTSSTCPPTSQRSRSQSGPNLLPIHDSRSRPHVKLTILVRDVDDEDAVFCSSDARHSCNLVAGSRARAWAERQNGQITWRTQLAERGRVAESVISTFGGSEDKKINLREKESEICKHVNMLPWRISPAGDRKNFDKWFDVSLSHNLLALSLLSDECVWSRRGNHSFTTERINRWDSHVSSRHLQQKSVLYNV